MRSKKLYLTPDFAMANRAIDKKFRVPKISMKFEKVNSETKVQKGFESNLLWPSQATESKSKSTGKDVLTNSKKVSQAAKVIS